jgi:hypothetical protein
MGSWTRGAAALLAAGLLAVTLAPNTSDEAQAIEGGASASDMAASVVRITYNGKLSERNGIKFWERKTIQWCSGTVVGDGWVLTAYHCLTDAGGDWGGFRVEIWRNGTVGSGTVYRSALARPPLYQSGASGPQGRATGYADVMLLQTASPMPSWAKTVPMAMSWPALGTKLTQYGYGRTINRPNTAATTLQKTPDHDLARVDCGTVAPGYDWKAGHICAKGTRSTAWKGDSGGPLLWWVNGYWQQVGDFSIYPDVQGVHWQGYWSEADATTRAWIASHVTGPIAYNTIVRDKDSGAAWLYRTDGYRHWIPDGTTYNCLLNGGAPVANWTLRRVETIPDKVGSWATCTAPPPPPTGPMISLSQGDAAPAGYWYSVVLTGFTPEASVTVTCRDSVDPVGFWNQTLVMDGSGRASDTTLCYSADGPDHWVTGGGVESNHVSWGGVTVTTLPAP